MKEHSNDSRIPWWHSLMYSTGFMLLLGAIPAGCAIGLSLMRKLNLNGTEALMAGASMLIEMSVIGTVLLLVARRITKRQQDADEKKIQQGARHSMR